MMMLLDYCRCLRRPTLCGVLKLTLLLQVPVWLSGLSGDTGTSWCQQVREARGSGLYDGVSSCRACMVSAVVVRRCVV